eukprot:scaffold42332_cov63-Phaeocystis_antarctica.AAC.5
MRAPERNVRRGVSGPGSTLRSGGATDRAGGASHTHGARSASRPRGGGELGGSGGVARPEARGGVLASASVAWACHPPRPCMTETGEASEADPISLLPPALPPPALPPPALPPPALPPAGFRAAPVPVRSSRSMASSRSRAAAPASQWRTDCMIAWSGERSCACACRVFASSTSRRTSCAASFRSARVVRESERAGEMVFWCTRRLSASSQLCPRRMKAPNSPLLITPVQSASRLSHTRCSASSSISSREMPRPRRSQCSHAVKVSRPTPSAICLKRRYHVGVSEPCAHEPRGELRRSTDGPSSAQSAALRCSARRTTSASVARGSSARW